MFSVVIGRNTGNGWVYSPVYSCRTIGGCALWAMVHIKAIAWEIMDGHGRFVPPRQNN